jgi:transcriptional/translational regulatory protein YebC/TACO1
MAGHPKWSNSKRPNSALDENRRTHVTKLAKKIPVAAKISG